MIRRKLILAMWFFGAAPVQAQQLSIRFLEPIESGRDPVGSRVLAETMEPLVVNGCTIAPGYSQLAGHLTVSRGGRSLGQHGVLAMQFDSVQLGKQWLHATAALDTLEYALIRSSVVRHVETAVALAAVSEPWLGLVWAVRHGPRAEIFPGELGRVRFTGIPPASGCLTSAPSDDAMLPQLPRFTPRTTNHNASVQTDPINVLLVGTRSEIDSAFTAAGWRRSQPLRGLHAIRAVVATFGNMHAANPAMSNLYFEGRKQDVAYEMEGPTARYRHHVRLWLLDAQQQIWAGASTRDDGLLLWKRTHRVDPRIDDEREVVVRALESGGQAHLLRYVTLPGAALEGKLAHGQPFFSDGQAAVVLVL